MSDDPFPLLQRWLQEAVDARLDEPMATCLATCDAQGRPSARMVLLRGVTDEELRFYTNYNSRKARELESFGFAALCFHWQELGRQLRVEGAVQRLDASESDLYFASRSRESRLSAWASAQSETIDSREALLEELRRVHERFAGEDPPRPPNWGGYALRPDRIEFWVRGEHRLHERMLCERQSGAWSSRLLAP